MKFFAILSANKTEEFPSFRACSISAWAAAVGTLAGLSPPSAARSRSAGKSIASTMLTVPNSAALANQPSPPSIAPITLPMMSETKP